MKNKKEIIIVSVVILIVISNFISISIYKNAKTDIQLTNQSWDSYDNSINIIKNNMDSITEPNENFTWWELKSFDIEDNEYEKTLNLLVADVRMCYLEYTDDGTLYTNTNPIRKFRNKQNITAKELKKLNFDMYNESRTGCLKNFDRYNGILISNDEKLRNKVLNKINDLLIIKSTELFNSQSASYNELLLRKTMEVQSIKNISDFLVGEYNRLK